jgi:hypothetical protein
MLQQGYDLELKKEKKEEELQVASFELVECGSGPFASFAT